MRIFKQVLAIEESKCYSLAGDEVHLLSVKEQNGRLVLYFTTNASEDNKQSTTTARIYILGTGHQRDDIPKDAEFLGTVIMSYGLVWHCYGKIESCGKTESTGSFTAGLYSDDGITYEDLSTYDSADEAIKFAISRGWDEVVNDLTGEVIFSNRHFSGGSGSDI